MQILPSSTFTALNDPAKGKDEPPELVETILYEELFEKVLSDLGLESILSSKKESRALNNLLNKIGAVLVLNHKPEKTMLRFDVLISALKVHGYVFGDLTYLTWIIKILILDN